MSNCAKIGITGRLTRDPEQRQYQGTTVVSFTVAVNTTKKDKDDKYVSDFYSVSVWGKLGEYALPRVWKGALVQVYGDLQLQSFKDKNTGEERQALSVRATDVIPLSKKDDNPNKNNEPTGEPDPF